MPKALTCDSATGRPISTSQTQTPTTQPQTTQQEAIPSVAAAEEIGGEVGEQPTSSPLYFPPSDPFESDDENEGPSASIPNEGQSATMAVSEPHPAERGSVAAITSARKTKYSGKSGGNKSQRQPSRAVQKKQTIATGKRVFVERKVVKYRLDVDSPGYEVTTIYQSDKFRFYGTVVGKPPNSKLYKVKLDLLPSDCNEILVVRKDITVLAKGEEEPPYDPRHDAMVEECKVVGEKPAASSKKSRDFIGESYKSFSELDTDLQAAARHFELQYGEGEDEKVVWKILSEKEQITVCPMEEALAGDSAGDGCSPLEDSPFLDDIPWDKNPNNVDYNSVLFEKFFPSLKGKAAVLDEFLSHPSTNPEVPNKWKDRVADSSIKFHRPEAHDPDALVKICMTLMITSVLEVHKGIAGLWQRGNSSGMKDYPNYGQYIPKDYFKAFMYGLPYLWAEKKFWDINPAELPFDFLAPFIKEYNSLRTTSIRVIYLMLDESMSGWRPKTSKRGGLPHISHEPRKPVPLGTMIRNAVECTTGIFVHHDLVDSSNEQWKKKFSLPPETSHLPRKEEISYHCAEVLRQCEESKVVEGGWVGGDAWFGSIESCLELKKRFNVYSTFIIKQNVNYYPMQVLHKVLLARHGSKPAGHWVVMQTTIAGVELIAMAYAWSQKGVAYMISSCGKTVMHEEPYLSRYEDDYGNVQEKELPRPTVAHMLYEFLPLIDEHNKSRQNALALEKCWLTKNCWVRLLTTFLGMAVIDLLRWDRRKRYGHVRDLEFTGDFIENMDEDMVDDFDVRTMANLIGRPLSDGRLRYRLTNQPSARTATSNSTMKPVVRITGKDGSIVHPKRDERDDKKVRVRQQSCFICRQYTQKTINTQWKCRICGMPLCQVDRSDSIARRPYSCIDEHLSSHNEYIGCNLMKRNSFILPDNLRKYTMTRQQEQIREQDRQRKRMQRQGQSDSTESVSTSEKEQHMALVRERESRRMNEARAACSRTMQRLMKRTRTGSDTQQRVLRSRK
jgi:hypothetical protein